MLRIIFIFLCSISIAMAGTFTCDPIKVATESKNFVLPGGDADTPQVYLFKNISSQGVWLDHPVTKRTANIGWSSYLQKGHWSAFVLTRKNFIISCAVIQPGLVKYYDCPQIISVCTPKEAAFKKASKNSYWLSEDESWEDLLKSMEKRGVTLK